MKKNLAYIILFFCSIILFSCGNKDEEEITIPSTVLSEEKYVKLLVDFSLAESAGNLNIKNVVGLKFDSAYAFNPLKENNVSQALYDSSLSFYSKHPKLYKKLCEEVLTELSKMQMARSTTKSDSLINLAIKLKQDSITKSERRKDSLEKKKANVKKDLTLKKSKKKKKKKKGQTAK